MDNFSDTEIMTAFNAVVDEMGEDYVYPEELKAPSGIHLSPICQYTVNGEGACIVGKTLHRLGIDPEYMPEGKSAEFVLNGLGYSSYGIVVAAMTVAQAVQDQGGTWGKARTAANETISISLEDNDEA